MRDYLVHRISPEETYEDLLSFPRYLEIETVNACNARCPMCTIDDWDRRNGLMSDELFDKIAQEIGAHPEVKRVHLYRDGEPLLDKKLADKTKKLKALGVKRIGISTNVALLTPQKSFALLEAGLDEIILSIDSLNPKVYEAIRLRLNFDEVLHNALKFISLRDTLKSKCQIWMRMIRQESNKDEWPSYQAFWKDKLQSTDRLEYKNIHNWGSQLKGFKSISIVRDIDKPCVALWSLMVIFANGDVPMCNVDYNNKFPLGNVRNSTIEELWQSTNQALKRHHHITYQRGIYPICKGCTVWSEASPTDNG